MFQRLTLKTAFVLREADVHQRLSSSADPLAILRSLGDVEEQVTATTKWVRVSTCIENTGNRTCRQASAELCIANDQETFTTSGRTRASDIMSSGKISYLLKQRLAELSEPTAGIQIHTYQV